MHRFEANEKEKKTFTNNQKEHEKQTICQTIQINIQLVAQNRAVGFVFFLFQSLNKTEMIKKHTPSIEIKNLVEKL